MVQKDNNVCFQLPQVVLIVIQAFTKFPPPSPFMPSPKSLNFCVPKNMVLKSWSFALLNSPGSQQWVFSASVGTFSRKSSTFNFVRLLHRPFEIQIRNVPKFNGILIKILVLRSFKWSRKTTMFVCSVYRYFQS